MSPRAWTGRKRHSTCYWPKPWTEPPTDPWSPHQSSLSRCKTSTTTHPSFPSGPTMPQCPRCPMWVSTLGLDIPECPYLPSPTAFCPHILLLSEPISFNSALLMPGSHSSALLPHLALSWLSGVPEPSAGTSVIQVTAHDADDPSYGNSAKLVYTVLDGLPFFSVDPQTGEARAREPGEAAVGSGNPDPLSLSRSGADCHPQHGPGDTGGVLSGDSSQGHGRPHGGAVGQHHGDGHPQRCQRQPPQVPSE